MMFYLQDTNIAFGDQPIDSEHRKDNNQNKIDPGIFIAREFLSRSLSSSHINYMIATN